MDQLIHSILSSPDFGAALATLITVTLTAVVGFLGQAIRAKVKATLTAEQLNILQTIANIAVQMAEQTGATKAAQEKKAAAVASVQAYVDGIGLKGFSVAQIDAAVESAVYGMSYWRQIPAPPVEAPAAP